MLVIRWIVYVLSLVITSNFIFLQSLISQSNLVINSHSNSQETISALLNSYKNKSLSAKITFYSEYFLNQPYQNSPLGEDIGYDSDPLYRLDSFDCVTFVETVLALANSDNFMDFYQKILQIRYKNLGNITFLTRNHFMTIDWIPNNNKYVEDITLKIGKQYAHLLTNQFHKKTWFIKNHHMNTDFQDNIKGQLYYIPKKYIPLILHSIPEGAILNIVKPQLNLVDKIGTNILITHTGFVIIQDQKVWFRSASSIHHQVIDQALIPYINQHLKEQDGINLLMPIVAQTHKQP